MSNIHVGSLSTEPSSRLSKTFFRLIEEYKKTIAAKIEAQRPFIEEGITNHVANQLKPYLDTINKLYEMGFLDECGFYEKSRSIGLNGFTTNSKKLKETLNTDAVLYMNDNKINFNNLDVEIMHKIKEVENLVNSEETICLNVESFVNAIANKYGTVNYMLTQFPELAFVYPDRNKAWKPNPNYKVTPRNSFENPDIIIKFLGNCALEGITYEH
jgi:hypothetical protein